MSFGLVRSRSSARANVLAYLVEESVVAEECGRLFAYMEESVRGLVEPECLAGGQFKGVSWGALLLA